MAEQTPSIRDQAALGATQDQSAGNLAQAALADAEQSLNDIQAQVDSQRLNLPDLGGETMTDGAMSAIELLGDVELHVSVELGRTQMLVEDVLRLAQGSIVELDKLAGDPVDVYVNSRLVARGEVLVLNDNFCIRISEIVSDLEEQVQVAAHQVAQAG
ncbi:MAG: flagellar motor switch protein FliN [Phycisphaeraceae bacterium]